MYITTVGVQILLAGQTLHVGNRVVFDVHMWAPLRPPGARVTSNKPNEALLMLCEVGNQKSHGS